MVAYHIGKRQTRPAMEIQKHERGYAEAHQIRIADVDYDGKDEVLHIGYAERRRFFRYVVPTVVHGDRWYVGAFNKNDR